MIQSIWVFDIGNVPEINVGKDVNDTKVYYNFCVPSLDKGVCL